MREQNENIFIKLKLIFKETPKEPLLKIIVVKMTGCVSQTVSFLWYENQPGSAIMNKLLFHIIRWT